MRLNPPSPFASLLALVPRVLGDPAAAGDVDGAAAVACGGCGCLGAEVTGNGAAAG